MVVIHGITTFTLVKLTQLITLFSSNAIVEA